MRTALIRSRQPASAAACATVSAVMLGPMVLNLCRIRDWVARGLAMGTAGHGIGTARAMQVNEMAGVFSGLAMGLNALATAVLLPLLWRLFFAREGELHALLERFVT
jgi:putative effector of murein hydrolase